MLASQSPAPAPDTRPRLTIPFSGPLYYKIKNLAKQLNINIIATSTPTLASRLCSRVKIPVNDMDKSGVIYSIDCSCGGVYLGETLRPLGVRSCEHQRDWEKGRKGSPWAAHRTQLLWQALIASASLILLFHHLLSIPRMEASWNLGS